MKARRAGNAPTPLPHGRVGAVAPPADPYDDPVLFDIVNTPGTAAEVSGLMAIEKCYGAPGRRSQRRTWLEPACGTGRYLKVLAARGQTVVGFDRNAAFVDYARRRLAKHGVRARIVIADLEEFTAAVGGGPVDIAFNLHNTIRHLESDAALLRHLAGISRVLKPGGIYAVGLSYTRYGLEEITEDLWSGARGRCRVSLLVQYFPPAIPFDPSNRWEEVIQHRTVTTPAGATHADICYRLRSYDRRQWERLVRRSGFETVAVVDAGGEPIDPEAFDYAIHLLRRSR